MNRRVVLVTGAAGALGSATARAFGAVGAKLVLVDRAGDALAKVYANAFSPDALLLGGVDVTNAESLAEMTRGALARFERIDALVNIAGTYKGSPLLEADEASWDALMNLNARSVLLACQAVVPTMLKQGSGCVVNIGSSAALAAFATGGIYAASKAAVLRVTEALSAELKEKGIRVNAVLPGTMDTPGNRASMPDADPDRWVKTEAVADVIVFLCSDGARAIHGASVPVSG